MNVLVTGADRGLGAAMVRGLLAGGHRVFAGQYMTEWPELDELKAQYGDQLDIVPLDVGSDASVAAAGKNVAKNCDGLDVLINNAGITAPTMYAPIRERQSYEDMLRIYNVNALGALRTVEALLPLMDKGTAKRLCFVSSEAGSIARSYRTSWFGYCMSKSALNMGVSILHNSLRPEGYTFRLYHPGWVRSYMSGQKNLLGDLEPDDAAVPALAYFLGESGSVDEDGLALCDYEGKAWPW